MRMDELPLAILSNILSKVSSQSLLRCRCVCKRWQEAIDDSYFRSSLHCPKEPVLVHHGYKKEEICLLKIQEEAPMKMIPIAIFPELKGGYVLQGACNGFLLFGHLIDAKNNPELLINPLTKEILRLPRAPELQPNMSVYGFGFDCAAHTYKLVQIDTIDYDEETRTSTMRARVYDFEKRSWRTCKAPPPSQLPFPALVSPYGALNWFYGTGWIVSFDFTNEEFSSIPVPENRSNFLSQYIEMEGSPALLRYAYPSRLLEVRVLKDSTGGAWTSKYKIQTDGQYYHLLGQHKRNMLVLRQDRDMCLYDVDKERFTRCRTEDIPECHWLDWCASVALSLASLERLFGEETSEVDGNARSELDNVSSPPAAAVSSVASQLHHLNLGEGRVKEVVRTTNVKTAVISRSHVLPLRAVDLLKNQASRARSDLRASRNNVACSPRNDSGKFPSASGGSLTTCNRNGSEFNGEASDGGPRTCATLHMLSEPEEQGIPHDHPCEALADTYDPNSHGPPHMSLPDFMAQWVGRPSKHHALGSSSRDIPSVPWRSSAVGPQLDLPEISVSEGSGSSEATPSNSWTSCLHPFGDPQDLVLDSPFAPSRDVPIQRPERMSENAPRFTPSASIHQSSEILLQGNNLCTGLQNTHPDIEPSYYQSQLPLQYGYVSSDGYMHQNYGYSITSPQQEVYQAGNLSRANADPSTGSTPDRFLPTSPVPADISRTQQKSSLHVQAQNQHGNYYHPIGMGYNFAARNNQPDPVVKSALPRQQQGSLPGWVPLPSDGNGHMPSVQQEVYKEGSLSQANANASGWESFQGTGSTSYQSPPIPPYSPTPFNMFWTSSDSPLHAQDQYKKYVSPFINSWTGRDSTW